MSVFIETKRGAPGSLPGGADVALPAVRVSTSNGSRSAKAGQTTPALINRVVNMVSHSAEMNVVAMGNVPAAAVTAIAGSVCARVAGR